MAFELNPRLISFYHIMSRASGGTVLTVGLLVLAGWLWDVPILTSLLPGMATMKANSALGFILSGITLWVHHDRQVSKPGQLLANVCAVMVMLIGGLTLGEYALNRDFGIDQLLFKEDVAPQAVHPGRMSPSTALNFFLLGLALLLLSVHQLPRLRESCTFIALIISILVLIGYIYGVPSLYEFFPYSATALHTALAFSILSIGILLARPDAGVMRLFSSNTLGGVMARRLTPAALVIPILLGWLFLSGQRLGLYDSTLRLVLFAMSNVIIFALLIGWNAELLSRVDVKRGQAENALSLNEKRSQALIENSLDAVALFGAEGTILYGGPSTPQVLGYSVDEFVGRNAFELIHKDDQALVAERMKLSFQQPGAHIPVYARVRHKNGEWRWLEGVLTNLLHEPSIQAIVNNYHDFTERRQAEEAIKTSEERFRLIVEATPSAMIAVDLDGKIDLVNAKAQELFGYRQEELLGHPVEMLVPQRFRGTHVILRQSFLAQPTSRPMGAGRDLFGMHKDGHEVPIEIGLAPYESSDGLFTLALIVDITERTQAENALQRLNDDLENQVQERTAALSEANALLQILLDQMPDHIYFKDAQSRFIRNSRSQAKALGLNDPAEVIGKSDFDFFSHAHQSFEKEQEIIRSGRPLIDQEERIVWPNGRESWVSTTKAPLRDQAGKIIGTFGISRDITDRKRAEIALQKAKLELEAANKELEAFSYSVSHDLRAPLRSVDGFSQALLEDYGETLPPEGRNFLERIRNSAQRMAELIDDLLNLSRVTRAPLKSVAVDLSKLVENIAAELKRNDPERAVRFIIAQNLRAGGDPHLLQVVLENLMNNAWKFTSKRELAEIEIGTNHQNGETIFFIRDNGAGFDMTYANKLFGAFQRLHAMAEFPGTGIGLATIQRIIHRHGGRIWAQGAVDHGATFFFTLPALERAKPEAVPHEIESLAKRVKEII